MFVIVEVESHGIEEDDNVKKIEFPSFS